MKSNWKYNWNNVESTILKSNSNQKILVGYHSDYYYPKSDIKNQLRIMIARRQKETNDIDIMYSVCKLIPIRTEITIDKFNSGQRTCGMFEYEKDHLNNENIDYGHAQKSSLQSNKIYIK